MAIQYVNQGQAQLLDACKTLDCKGLAPAHA